MSSSANNPVQIPPRVNRHMGRSEPISHERAKEAALRLIHSHFGTTDHARIHIPMNVDDDDVVLMDYIQQQVAKDLGLR